MEGVCHLQRNPLVGSPALSRLDLWRERRKGRERGKKLSKLSLAPFLANRNFITVVSVLKPFCVLRKKMCQGDEHARLHHDPSSADNQQETMSSLVTCPHFKPSLLPCSKAFSLLPCSKAFSLLICSQHASNEQLNSGKAWT